MECKIREKGILLELSRYNRSPASITGECFLHREVPSNKMLNTKLLSTHIWEWRGMQRVNKGRGNLVNNLSK